MSLSEFEQRSIKILSDAQIFFEGILTPRKCCRLDEPPSTPWHLDQP
jgi:hypothetical protein